jgi:hypothetical protein
MGNSFATACTFGSLWNLTALMRLFLSFSVFARFVSSATLKQRVKAIAQFNQTISPNQPINKFDWIRFSTETYRISVELDQ